VVTLWSILKWPLLVLVVMGVFGVLYYVGPNVEHGGFRWITPGGVLGVTLWAAASAGFALYVTHLGSYNKTYGSLGAAIVFLVWLWLSNTALLLGAQFNAELERTRALQKSFSPHESPSGAVL